MSRNRFLIRHSARKSLLGCVATACCIVFVLVLASVIRGDQSGSEFQVNSHFQNDQIEPVIALNTSGNSVIVWSSLLQDGSGYGVYAQMVDSTGAKHGPEWRVDSETVDDQNSPDVAIRADGSFIVVWHTARDYQPTSHLFNGGILYMDYTSAGTPVPPFPPFITDDPDEYDPSVAVSSQAASSIIVWTAMGKDGSGEGVFGEQLGQPWSFPGHSINSNTSGDQNSPDVAMDGGGNSVVVWCSEGQDGDLGGVYGQRFSSNGSAAGSEFRVNSHTGGDQFQPSVSMDSAGDFIVVWSSDGQDGSGTGVYGQMISSSGTPLGSEFRVNSNTTGNQSSPSVSMSSSGDFVVVWSSEGADGNGLAVMGQRYLAGGAPVGGEFVVNTYTSGDQMLPCVSLNAAGDFAVAWQSYGQDGSGWGVYAQAYNQIPIPEMPLFPAIAFGTALIALTVGRARHLRSAAPDSTERSFRIDNE